MDCLPYYQAYLQQTIGLLHALITLFFLTTPMMEDILFSKDHHFSNISSSALLVLKVTLYEQSLIFADPDHDCGRLVSADATSHSVRSISKGRGR